MSAYFFASLIMNSTWTNLSGSTAAGKLSCFRMVQATLARMVPSGNGRVPAFMASMALSFPRMTRTWSLSGR